MSEIQELEQEVIGLRNALKKIKYLVCGDKLPPWKDYCNRRYIADLCEIGEMPWKTWPK